MKTKSIITMALAAAVFVSCSDWTEPESIKIEVSSLEKDNPELYAEYCSMIRDYKASDHKISYIAFDNQETFPDQSYNLTSLPDSVDFVELSNPEIAGVLLPQMEKLRSEKAFKFAVAFSYDKVKATWTAACNALKEVYDAECAAIKAAYDAAKKAAEEAGEDPDTVPAPTYPEEPAYPEITGFFTEELSTVFGYVDALELDAVRVQYAEVKDTYHLTAEELEAYKAEEKAFFDTVLKEFNSREGVSLLLNTRAEYIVSEEYVKAAEYIILSCEDLTGTADMDYLGTRTNAVYPDAKLLYSVTNTSADDYKVGCFTAGEQIPLASKWMSVPAKFGKDGLVIYDARSLFYDSNRNVYSKLRTAIKNMNPNS